MDEIERYYWTQALDEFDRRYNNKLVKTTDRLVDCETREVYLETHLSSKKFSLDVE
jgi:hypothetical protein